jgi:hypothetical protein
MPGVVPRLRALLIRITNHPAYTVEIGRTFGLTPPEVVFSIGYAGCGSDGGGASNTATSMGLNL